MTPSRTASEISVREVLAKFETDFATTANALENGEFALWVGSGISRQAPNLGDLIERALDFLRVRAIDPASAEVYRPALEQALKLADFEPADLSDRYESPLAGWPERNAIVSRLWNNYSRVLDIRIMGEPADFVLWDAIDIRAAFAAPKPPAAEHLCIAILILEGAVRTVASANWDGFIEAAIARLSANATGVMQVVVDPNDLRDAAAKAKLLKFHGCIVYATQDPETFRKFLTGSRTQITEWPENPLFAAMKNAIVDVATNQKSLVLGLSIQDNNLQSVFSKAKQVNPWPWPCAPQAPGHVFCEDVIRDGQTDVLKIVYGDSYNDHVSAIHTATHLRAWGEQVLLALVLKLLTDKLSKLMELALSDVGKSGMSAELASLLNELRNKVAEMATGDRTAFCYMAIAVWSRLMSLFRTGALPANAEAYESISNSVPNMLVGDHNARATGLGRLGVVLAMLQHANAAGLWELTPPAFAEVAAGALTVRGNWGGAPTRPLFIVRSASEAIALEQNGAFADDDAIVLHADKAWHRMLGGASARTPRSAPGRIGRVRTTHVSVGALIDECRDVDALKRQFVVEATV